MQAGQFIPVIQADRVTMLMNPGIRIVLASNFNPLRLIAILLTIGRHDESGYSIKVIEYHHPGIGGIAAHEHSPGVFLSRSGNIIRQIKRLHFNLGEFNKFMGIIHMHRMIKCRRNTILGMIHGIRHSKAVPAYSRRRNHCRNRVEVDAGSPSGGTRCETYN